jgi:hypothetical protein
MLIRLGVALLLLVGPIIAAGSPEKAINSGKALGDALAGLATPGPPEVLLISNDISIEDAGRLPVTIARNLTLRGTGTDGADGAAELSLAGRVDGWRLGPGVVVTVQNLTLSNLALRPEGAPSPPPANGEFCASRLASGRPCASSGAPSHRQHQRC